MTRFHRIGAALTAATAVWLAACYSVPESLDSSQQLALWFLPLLLLAMWGLYALVLLIAGVLSFRTVPAEAESLRRDIDEANRFYLKRGVLLH